MLNIVNVWIDSHKIGFVLVITYKYSHYWGKITSYVFDIYNTGFAFGGWQFFF